VGQGSVDGVRLLQPETLALMSSNHLTPSQRAKSEMLGMPVDELWSLHEFVSSALASRISAEKARLDQRLRQLGLDAEPHKMSHARRPYPQVFPKYRNPAEPSETWAGRGMKPRWLTAQLKSGKRIDDFRIN
jgi:DNA-binding protein H-NS